jgi:hypothetical protein
MSNGRNGLDEVFSTFKCLGNISYLDYRSAKTLIRINSSLK